MGWSDVEHPDEVEKVIIDKRTKEYKQRPPKQDRTPHEILDNYLSNPNQPHNPINPLTLKQRAHVLAEVEGVSPRKYGYTKDPSVLSNPKVQLALEDILDRAGLNDRKLAKKMKEIIFKGKGANKDNVSHNAIRTVWQLKGKFAPERVDIMHRSDLEKLSDGQLDRIIESGIKEFSVLRVKLGLEQKKEEDASSPQP